MSIIVLEKLSNQDFYSTFLLEALLVFKFRKNVKLQQDTISRKTCEETLQDNQRSTEIFLKLKVFYGSAIMSLNYVNSTKYLG